MSDKRSWFKRLSTERPWFTRLAILCLVLFLLTDVALVIGYRLYREHIVENPGPHLERTDILRRISMESPVYYRDGAHKIGVFFGAEHRQYVKYADIPPDFVKAIVASEDKNFFAHHGIDPMGILRAMVQNVKARRVVAGGSTITQQTAKNLYYRADRSWEQKYEELLNALRLEAHYTKQEILEFYVNQFHVYSNGRGLGIAARYFFDKDVKDLSTLEYAFLAGVVKGPQRYNPFVGTTEEQRAGARRRARIRTHYVLDRMLQQGYLTPEQHASLKKQELKLKEGDFRYERNVILDYVFDVLQEERFAKLLLEHGIDNPATAGIQVTTTVDRDYQHAAEYGLRHQLSDVGAMLEGLTVDAFVGPPFNPMPLEEDDLHPYGFYEGRVKGFTLEGKGAPYLEIDLGGITGRVEREGLRRVADLIKRTEGKNTWTRATDKEVKALASKFPVGRQVWVSVGAIDEMGVPQLDLEARTELQGAVTILDRGQIRAMVGGQDNRNFNRVATARRQLGSTFKPLVYAAAITLGWGALSPLDNRRQGFFFQNQWYWPRPDHEGVMPYLSMGFAGSTSENLASVSLLYHLTDLLLPDQMIDLANRVGMAPEPLEAKEEFAKRVRDKYGIVPTDASLAEGLYEAFKRELKVELAFNGKTREAIELAYVPYGNGFAAESIRTGKLGLPSSERDVRHRFLDRSFLMIEELAPKALAAAEVILRGWTPTTIPGTLSVGSLIGAAIAPEEQASTEAINAAMRNFFVRKEGEHLRLIYARRADPSWTRPSLADARWLLTGGSLSSAPQIDIPGVRPGTEPPKKDPAVDPVLTAGLDVKVEPENPSPAPSSPSTPAGQPGSGSTRPEDSILIEGALSPSTVAEIRKTLDLRIQESSELERYDMQRLILHQDYRIMVGLQYVIQMARALGVKSPMKPVISMALGTNEITLLEAAMIYQAFQEGKAFSFSGGFLEPVPPEKDEAGTTIIQQIKDASGEVIYEMQAREQPVLDPSVGPTVGRILRAVVERGTGYRYRKLVRVASPDPVVDTRLKKANYIVPFFGKTGTTNDYMNVVFVGFVPSPQEKVKELPYGSTLTVAAYVGYDDNRPMKRGSIRVQGSNGALPALIDAAQGVIRSQDLVSRLDPAGLLPGVELKIAWPRDMAAVAVDQATGLRTGVGVVATPEELPTGSVMYEIYGTAVESEWRERESYLPFTPWGKEPETAPPAVDAAAAQSDAAVPEESPARPAEPPVDAPSPEAVNAAKDTQP